MILTIGLKLSRPFWILADHTPPKIGFLVTWLFFISSLLFQDCPDYIKSTFDYCIAGLPGGQDAAPQEYKCSSDHFYKDDWFPLLCVMFEYNAFLGYFYEWQYKLGNNTQAFLQRLSSVFFYSYRYVAIYILW